MALMRQNIDLAKLEAEVVKAPHHGSDDFDFEALQAMKPVVSLISSGDESTNKEYIHPRDLGVSSRQSQSWQDGDRPLYRVSRLLCQARILSPARANRQVP